MPLFCTLANQYTGTNTPAPNKFENRGYPLMFEGKNKHMFFLDPEDTTKTVQKFYGAPLTVYHEAEINNPNTEPSTYYQDLGADIDPLTSVSDEVSAGTLMFGSSFRAITRLEVNDHQIRVQTNRIAIPHETMLSLGISTLTTKTLSHGEIFTAIAELKLNNHKITPKYNQFTLPTETQLTLSKSSLYDDPPIISRSHNYINLTNQICSVNNHTITYRDITVYFDFPNTHSVTHAFSITGSNITLSSCDSSGINGATFKIVAGDGITITGSGTTMTITNSKPDVDHNTDTKCTSPENHYTPSGTAHNGNLVRGITYDSKGHITDIVRTTSVNDIRVVTALPSDAGSYPDTLFLVTGGG